MAGRKSKKQDGVTSLVANFGSNRMLAHRVGGMLAGCEWVGVPFAGGMCELRYIAARTINVNDKHAHVVNLARTIADFGPLVYRRLKRIPFHPESLRDAQQLCQEYEHLHDPSERNRIGWAVAYFVVAWMTRHGAALTEDEFKCGMSTRWSATGGDSNKHYRSAMQAVIDWHRVLQVANFTNLDWREFYKKCKDLPRHGIYVDAPWPDDGVNYTHKFDEAAQRELATANNAFEHARVVIRYADHPLIRELYPESRWTWLGLEGRTQANKKKAEVLIINTPWEA